MKRYYLILISICALLSSCVRAYDEGCAEGQYLYTKKVDGKQYWGVVRDKHAFPYGKYIFLRMDDDERPGIKCEYDKIEYKAIGPLNMYVAYKGSEVYYFDEVSLSPKANGNPVWNVEFVKDFASSCFGNRHIYKFYTKDGVYSCGLGPCQDIFVGYYGYAIKDNGKWGFYYGRYDLSPGRDDKYYQIAPCIYDELIEVDDEAWGFVLLLRKGAKWKAIDKSGKELFLSDYMRDYILSKKQQKIKETNEECAIVSVPWEWPLYRHGIAFTEITSDFRF